MPFSGHASPPNGTSAEIAASEPWEDLVAAPPPPATAEETTATPRTARYFDPGGSARRKEEAALARQRVRELARQKARRRSAFMVATFGLTAFLIAIAGLVYVLQSVSQPVAAPSPMPLATPQEDSPAPAAVAPTPVFAPPDTARSPVHIENHRIVYRRGGGGHIQYANPPPTAESPVHRTSGAPTHIVDVPPPAAPQGNGVDAPPTLQRSAPRSNIGWARGNQPTQPQRNANVDNLAPGPQNSRDTEIHPTSDSPPGYDSSAPGGGRPPGY